MVVAAELSKALWLAKFIVTVTKVSVSAELSSTCSYLAGCPIVHSLPCSFETSNSTKTILLFAYKSLTALEQLSLREK